MKTKLLGMKNGLKRKSAGFSMIEVLVASAILTIIVMMMGMLFQQTSLAWRAGSKRADSYMQIRSLVGALQRDASQAVDQYGLEQERKKNGNGDGLPGNQDFSGGNTIRFYTLSGKERSLSFITYDDKGKRKQEEQDPDSGAWKTVSDRNVMTTIERQANPNKPLVSIEFVEPKDKKVQNPYELQGEEKGKCLPLYMTIKASVQSSGYASEIGAASAGPDRRWGTKDDITTWSKRN